jgi:hypothetical protein
MGVAVSPRRGAVRIQLRRKKAIPTRPRPRSVAVEGSGTSANVIESDPEDPTPESGVDAMLWPIDMFRK